MTDKRTVQMVVAFLGFMAFIGLAMICALNYQGKAISDALISITMFTGGAVAGLLSKTSTEPEEVEVVDGEEAGDVG